MKGSHVVDRRSLSQFLDDGKDQIACLMKPPGGSASDGIYLVPRDLLGAVFETMWSGGSNEVGPLVGVKLVPSIAGFPGVIRGREDVEICEEKLVGALSAYTKADDGFMARHFDRHISQRISRKLAHTPLLPNHITLMGMSIGLLGAYFLSMAGYWVQFLGSLLFVFCVIVDGVDGELARLKLKESTFGHYLDIITDNIVHAAIFVGIAYGQYHNTGSEAYLWLLWFMLGGFVLCLIAVYQCILRLSAEEMEQSPMAIRAMALVSNRDFAYLIALLAVFGCLNWFLIGASVGSYLFAAGLWVISGQEKRKRGFVQAD
jgi:phosphatidylglycerophosphate synthase